MKGRRVGGWRVKDERSLKRATGVGRQKAIWWEREEKREREWEEKQ